MALADELLTDAQVAARLNLEIRQFQSALRRGAAPREAPIRTPVNRAVEE